MNNPTSALRKRSVFGAALLTLVASSLVVATGSANAQGTQTACGIAPTGMNVIETNNSYIRGTTGDDFICAGASANVIRGLAGDDIIYGGAGNDRLIGGTGNDIVYAGNGADIVIAYGGIDELWGGDGDDEIYGGYGADTMYGESGDDLLSGGFGTDELHGGDGDDRVIGGKGADILLGGDGADRLFGGWGTDSVSGGPGNDILFGGYAADTLIGGSGTDTIYSANGDTVHQDDAPVVESGYLGSYTLDDEEFGTQVTVTVDGSTRTIVTNALPDHDTGDFPTAGNPNTISAQDLSYEFPVTGTYTGAQSAPRTPGVAVNGVKFEPGTAETVTCTAGGTYRVEALQDVYNLGLDFNNAHVQPTGEYHYHGASELLADAYSNGEDLVHVGFAADGFLMYYSKSSAYTSGYSLSTEARTGTGCTGSQALGGNAVVVDGTTPDGTYTSDWVWSDAAGDLDECNGIEIDGTYAYVITDEFPFVSRCLNGQVDAGPGGPPPGR